MLPTFRGYGDAGVPRKSKIEDRQLRLEYMENRCSICRRSIKAMEKRLPDIKGRV